ncbi:hypothetical protein FGO68_gene14426 [Halteria grandinella]|uniref:DegT/DnrJ/EryC1/StrS family aminotransferase n=1 Tax=Halteria grandinella TaxID=5974 RepID=A0A8J8T2T3_HALGN|nr:hypothetical protein FGO68_gene14426 [Halteria grandinella]
MHTKCQFKQSLALFGGEKAVSITGPHEIWPPKATQAELDELLVQRQKDISIKGRTGIIQEFEDMFLNFLENRRKFAVTFNSGTTALFAAYFALGVKEDDEVIGPALTFHAALSPSYMLKANVVLVDVDKDTKCIDVNKIQEVITKKTKVLTVVHQWGHPANMDKVMAIAKKHNLKVIEDCSHAHGSKFKGIPVGTFGDIAVFSLQAAKMIYAGEGGILVTNSQKIHDLVTALGHYRDRTKEEVKDPDVQKYWVTGFGQKYRMSPLNAVIAKHSLLNYPERMKQRHAALNYLTQRLKEISYIEVPKIASYADMGAWYGFKPLFKGEKIFKIQCEQVLKALQAEGVEIALASAPILSSQPLFNSCESPLYPKKNHPGRLPAQRNTLPVAEYLSKFQLSLPTFNNWPADKAIIDQYIVAFQKVQNYAQEIR